MKAMPCTRISTKKKTVDIEKFAIATGVLRHYSGCDDFVKATVMNLKSRPVTYFVDR